MHRPRLWGAALMLVLLQACATGPNANPHDPLEPFNRGMTRFNDGLDKAVLKPAAQLYQGVTPAPVRTGVGNFFGNLSDVWSMVNNALQLKPKETVETLMRVGVNTLFGFGGVLDVASEMRLEKHREDFGLTLGHWGVGPGPYIVLPVLGPSTLRDSVALVAADSRGDLVQRVDNVPTRNSLIVLRAVDLRASLLGAGDVIDQAALDKYSFVRDAYLQRRRNHIGGKPEPEERYDLPEAAPGSTGPAGKENLQNGNKTSPNTQN